MPASQIAARVNSAEISVHEVDAVLARRPNLASARAKVEIVDQLIEERLGKQRAIQKKLDRSPQVARAVEAARSQILAQAYFQQIAEALPRPTPEEVRRYYAEHPELFAQRRVFRLEEIAIAPKAGIAAALRERAATGEPLEQIAEWLHSRGVGYAVNHGPRAAEQIPLDMLPTLQGMREGEARVIEAGDGLIVIRVLAAQAAPLDEASAAPLIEQFLLKRRASDAIAVEVKRLKEQAKIEYVGEFRRPQ